MGNVECEAMRKREADLEGRAKIIEHKRDAVRNYRKYRDEILQVDNLIWCRLVEVEFGDRYGNEFKFDAMAADIQVKHSLLPKEAGEFVTGFATWFGFAEGDLIE